MKKKLLVTLCVTLFAFMLNAQVTRINNNNSLQVEVPLSSGKTFLYSDKDSSIWATDGTLAGTVQISPTIKFDLASDYGLLNGKIIFRGITASTGAEVYISDGTPGGTGLLSDIYSGAQGSNPSEFTLMGGYLYFTAETAAEGRELWRTDGTSPGTTLVKDIVPGAGSSNTEGNYNLFSNGTFLLFAATTAAAGNELWISDGTSGGTVLLKDINTGNSGADSSNPDYFTRVNSVVLFTATDATDGEEIWKTDGTSGGTTLLKDINPGSDSSTFGKLTAGPFTFPFRIFSGFHIFNNHAYFRATDGTSTGELWSTDGTAANTILLKDIVTATDNSPQIPVFDAINFPSKFIFPVSDGSSRSEFWQSDGTPGGTVLFESFSPPDAGNLPTIFPPFSIDFTNGTYTQPLFQGNKFFFIGGTVTDGYELWVSDGTLGGTHMVKDIYPGTGNGIDVGQNISYLYTSTTFFFAANDGTHGNELWKTDGSAGATSMVYDINPNAGNADPQLSFFVSNNKVLFTATDGDDPVLTDLFVVNGTFYSLPVKLTNFTVTPQDNDALLQWTTQQEINTNNFTVQRSYDGQHFIDIGTVNAHGTSYSVSKYAYTDPGIMTSGKSIVYYRLNITDNDGKSVLSTIISLRITGSTEWNVRILSNPVQDYVNLMVNGVSGSLKLSIRDISGKIIYTKIMDNVNGQITLPVTLQRGIYLLESISNNERKILKFVR